MSSASATSTTAPPRPNGATWRPLRILNLYRLIVAGTFLILELSHSLPPLFGAQDHRLFTWCALLYLPLAVLAQVAIDLRFPSFPIQLYSQVTLDILVLSAMMLASGGVASGLGLMILITIAAASILTAGRTAILFAAMASLAVLGEEVYAFFQGPVSTVQYTQAGFLGAAFFATALLGHTLSRRIRESETLAEERAVAISQLYHLNEEIVRRMQSGILAVDRADRVLLLNDAATRLLGFPAPAPARGRRLAEVAPDLDAALQEWRTEHWADRTMGPGNRAMGRPYHASFHTLGAEGEKGTVVFLEDAALLRQRAQELKLASLGRLTASIAHEIRNPLGAISHAGQLLAESPHLEEEERHFTEIIRNNSRRIDQIVENVLNLGRRDHTAPQPIALPSWCGDFLRDFRSSHQLSEQQALIHPHLDALTVQCDPEQLRQIVWNLCENALKFSRSDPRIAISWGRIGDLDRPYVEVTDLGPGIPAEHVELIFDPFFTAGPKGTGLGLYIARELCEANQATLELHANTPMGCTFRILFRPKHAGTSPHG